MELNENEATMSLSEVARYTNVTRQAIYVAVKKKKLSAVKVSGRYRIFKKDVERYQLNKYNRDLRMEDGELIFDTQKGFFSIRQVCQMISSEMDRSYSVQHLYHLVRSGQLKAFKRGYAWVVRLEDVRQLALKELGYVMGQLELDVK